MPLQLRIVSDHSNGPGEDSVREFHEDGGTIGRGLQNDWILNDPDLFISGRHATIDFRGGAYYLADTSSNGVYFNAETKPVGRGNPRRLFDGDHIRMGNFEFQVNIDSGESLVMPALARPSVAPDHDDFVEEDLIDSSMKLLDEEEITGDEKFRTALVGEDNESTASVNPAAKTTPDDAEPPAANDAAAKASTGDLFESLLDGLGISRVDLHPNVDKAETIRAAGQALRELVEGVTALHAGRASLKDTFHPEPPTLQAQGNDLGELANATSDQLLQLLESENSDLARDSIRSVCRDLNRHQHALLEAMVVAFSEFSDQFDPDTLQEVFDRTINRNAFSFINRFNYWELYRDLYPDLTEEGSGRFARIFSEDFTRAYDRIIADERRYPFDGTVADPADPGLLETRSHEPQYLNADANVDAPMDEKSISQTGATEVDQNFIDELNDTMAREIYKAKKEA